MLHEASGEAMVKDLHLQLFRHNAQEIDAMLKAVLVSDCMKHSS